jgi:hypothetical protein
MLQNFFVHINLVTSFMTTQQPVLILVMTSTGIPLDVTLIILLRR